jgi:ubiquinone/menaquinone biosynthesis C-methylase UbiE
LTEFTGERAIPGLVDADLLNEHLARYRFAARFAGSGAQVLDSGCGSGYGTAEFGATVRVIGTDISADAILHARENFARPGVRFLQAACERLPFVEGCFDLVTAFEVIEHVEHWPELLEEARRVLKVSGVLLVSTPNKAYYAESRGTAGPNPYHRHEFEADEFRDALYAVFPHVRVWTQNHAEAIVFAPANPAGAAVEANGDPAAQHAHFFLAACSQTPLAANDVYCWVPASANLLRERERHIAKLEGELGTKNAWLHQVREDLAALQRAHEQTLTELRRQNEWAEQLNREMAESSARMLGWIHDLEARIGRGDREIERLNGHVAELEAELEARSAWGRDLEAQIGRGRGEIVRLNAHREELEADLAARAAWGETLDAQLSERAREVLELREQLERLHEERRLIAESRWVRLGRRLNVGPAVDTHGAGGE